ncbi:serine/threonine-protein phosphatase 6 regulatory ankyrin repeat subunit A-like [Portunus trituberculatus]|uniref:serine/threonine-protein phosphatase 6 regulatory ankyrin repeat subunit A-like n=1 Tax=Portunus trituberculatus TaxID=210409 RepID=UPI001E1CE9A6|nr:serine/threonine-protein phosphatase 6 regulatory ankyrin repeat subunit A-like [Portunus trituberculatus]
MVAAMNGHTQTVKALLYLGANPLATDTQGRTALHFAARQGWQECVAALLPVTPATAAHLEGLTPVHFASYFGQVQVLEQLAGYAWPLTARNSGGWTPLHCAAMGGHVSAVQWLVRKGVDQRVQDMGGRTPLAQAVHHGHHEVVTWLIKNGGGGVTEGSEAQRVSVEAVVSKSGGCGVTGWRTGPLSSPNQSPSRKGPTLLRQGRQRTNSLSPPLVT